MSDEKKHPAVRKMWLAHSEMGSAILDASKALEAESVAGDRCAKCGGRMVSVAPGRLGCDTCDGPCHDPDLRVDGEGDAARIVKNAIGFTRSEAWGQISDKARVVVLLDALRALLAQSPASDTESADTLTAGSDNRDVEQVDCPEGSADDLIAVYMTAYYAGKHGENTTYEQMCASIAAEARKPLVEAAEDALTVTASCAHERWYQRLWEAVRGEPWTGGPASEDSPIGLTQAEFDQCIADASVEARRGVVERVKEIAAAAHAAATNWEGEAALDLTGIGDDLDALAASPEEVA